MQGPKSAFLGVVLVLGLPAAAAEPDRSLLGDRYTIGVSVDFHNGLLHWLDSLAEVKGAGSTAGKTVPAHRAEFHALWGRPSDSDREMLRRYHAARRAFADGASPGDRHRLTLAFFEAADLDEALERASALGDPEAVGHLTQSIRHFEPRYGRVWRQGHIPRKFVERASAATRRDELADLLAGVARFFGVPPDPDPPPQLVLTPVPSGFGTHAQAIGRFLLIEIRDGETLADEVAPIVHENVHYLFQSISPARREALERAAVGTARYGADAWRTLAEALPTAIGQGVAERSFRGASWSLKIPWYHLEHVDAYAKRIFPLVDRALEAGRPFDEALVRRLVEAFPRAATPRSP